MKKLSLFMLIISALFITNSVLTAQDINSVSEGYNFTPVKEIKYTPVKNQNRSGTCWSYSGIGFLECELLRMNKGEYDLSDMWIVNKAYCDKADVYVRMHGNYNFGGGGAFFDVFNMIRKYGIVPEEIYSGAGYGEELPVHGELDALLKAYVDVVVTNPNKKLSTAWKKGYNAIVDAYLGATPETFTYKGVNYTPITFANSLGINFDDYISITSYTHHPFYTKFAVEIPDNWAMEESYNLPLEEMLQVMNYAVDNGYSIAWGSDVSDKGFNWKKGIAIVPDKVFSSTDGSDQARWEKLSQNEKEKELYTFERPGKEKVITQEMRQIAFDNYTTTDDHGMVIVGKAVDQIGNPYFIVKNSWGLGSSNPYNGLFYASESFVKMQTINIIVHKNAIPKEILKKLEIK